MGRTLWSGIFSPPPQNATTSVSEASTAAFNTAATTFVLPRVFTRETPRLWTAERPFNPDSESFFRDAVQEAPLSPLPRRVDTGEQNDPAEENLGRVRYSTPEREAESQRLLEQVRSINSIGELRPIFRRVQELEDEERIDRQLARQRRHAAMSAAAAAALAETEATLAMRGQQLGDLFAPLRQTFNTDNSGGVFNPDRFEDLVWGEDDSFDLSGYVSDLRQNAVVITLPPAPFISSAPIVPSDVEESSSDEQTDSDVELPDPRMFLRHIPHPTMGSH